MKDRLKKIDVPSQAPMENLPITERVRDKGKGPRSPQNGKPKMIGQD